MPRAKRVSFDTPPVVEVVFSVQFTTPRPMPGAYVGLFWQRLRSQYPRLEEAPPIVAAREGGQQELSVEVMGIPPLRRSWLVSEDGRSLIQIQDDRFLFNWKKTSHESVYPSYDVIMPQFRKHLTDFEAFLCELEVGKPEYNQFELTYVNIIDVSVGEGQYRESSVLVDHMRDESRKRYLPEPEGVNWQTTYSLPDEAGRLRVIAQSATATDSRRVLRLDMMARGFPASEKKDGLQEWFAMAHEWITCGFADSTRADLQKSIWKRKS